MCHGNLVTFYLYNRSHNISNMFTASAACSQQLTHMETPLRQVQNNPTTITTTFTTNLQLIPGKSITILTKLP